MSQRWLRVAPLALLLALPGAARGQEWVVDLSAGAVSHRTVAADVGSRSAVLSVRREGAQWLYLSGGAPLDSAAIPWAAAGAGGRLSVERGALQLGVGLAGHGFGYRDPLLQATGSGVTAEALPFAALTRGAARLEVHTGARAYSTALDTARLSRAVLDHGAMLRVDTDAGVALRGEGRVVQAAEGNFPYLGAGAEWLGERGAAWAFAGRWLSDAIPTTAWGVGGRLPVGEGFRVEVSLLQDANDPLYWNAPRRLWNVGVSRALGGRAGRVAPLVPVVADAAGGTVTLRLPVDEAEEAPLVGGDFNGWQPVRMTRDGEHWVATVTAAPGVYHYAFQGADGGWFVPASVPDRVDDGFGGESAVLIVR